MALWKRQLAVGLFGWILILIGLTWLEISLPRQEVKPNVSDASPSSGADLRSADDRIADYTLWLERLTGLLAISTIGLWYVTWRALNHAKDDAARQARDMRASISAANASAGAAEDALRHAQESSERQLRAYVHVVEARFDNLKGGEIPIAKIKIQNFGQTPAYNFSQAAILGLQNYPLIEAPPPIKGTEDPCSPIAPTGFVHIMPALKEPLTQRDVDCLLSGKFALFAVGEVAYIDCFGKSRFTKYCLFTGGKVNDGRVVPLGSSSSYITGNECN